MISLHLVLMELLDLHHLFLTPKIASLDKRKRRPSLMKISILTFSKKNFMHVKLVQPSWSLTLTKRTRELLYYVQKSKPSKIKTMVMLIIDTFLLLMVVIAVLQGNQTIIVQEVIVLIIVTSINTAARSPMILVTLITSLPLTMVLLLLTWFLLRFVKSCFALRIFFS